jgi:hypothetical protein
LRSGPPAPLCGQHIPLRRRRRSSSRCELEEQSVAGGEEEPLEPRRRHHWAGCCRTGQLGARRGRGREET